MGFRFGTLHWPAGGLDLVVGGISYVELLILYELWAGERLSLEKAHPPLSSATASTFSVGCSFQALIFGALVVSLVL